MPFSLPPRILLLVLCGIPALAQQNTGDEIVSVPKKYVSAEGLNHQASTPTVPEQVSQWVGIGKEIGEATREGLNAVVDTSEKFGSTKVGTFVMVMIAWRVIGKEILGVILGIPLLIAGTWVAIYFAKRVFFGYQVIDRVEGKTKFYKEHAPLEFESSEAKAMAGGVAVIMCVGFLIGMLAVIF